MLIRSLLITRLPSSWGNTFSASPHHLASPCSTVTAFGWIISNGCQMKWCTHALSQSSKFINIPYDHVSCEKRAGARHQLKKMKTDFIPKLLHYGEEISLENWVHFGIHQGQVGIYSQRTGEGSVDGKLPRGDIRVGGFLRDRPGDQIWRRGGFLLQLTGQTEDREQRMRPRREEGSGEPVKDQSRRKSISPPLVKERSSIPFLSKQLHQVHSLFSHHSFINDQLNHQLGLGDICHLLYCASQRHLVRILWK